MDYYKMLFIAIFKLRLQPSEFENLYFYEVSLLMNNYEEYLNEQKKQNEEQEKEYSKNMPNMNNFNPNNFKPNIPSSTSGFGRGIY